MNKFVRGTLVQIGMWLYFSSEDTEVDENKMCFNQNIKKNINIVMLSQPFISILSMIL